MRRTWLVRIFLPCGTLPGSMKRTRSVKGKNRAIFGFQQAFRSWLYLRQYSRGHSMQVMEKQRGQSAGSVFGRVVWNVASRAFTNTVASERTRVLLYCASRSRARRRGRRENAPRTGCVRLGSCCVRLAFAAWGLTRPRAAYLSGEDFSCYMGLCQAA